RFPRPCARARGVGSDAKRRQGCQQPGRGTGARPGQPRIQQEIDMLSRRKCLHLLAASGLYSLMPPLTLMAAPGDYRLVVVVLRGAWDGLDVVRPHGDPAYAQLRPMSARAQVSDTIDLDGFYGLHPALAPVEPLFKNKE